MALEGTIKDFGLPDIFQLIGLQRAEAQTKRAEWPEVWKRASDKALRGWLG